MVPASEVKGIFESAWFWQMAFQGASTIALASCLFIMRRLLSEFDELKQKYKDIDTRCPIVHARHDSELAAFRVHVANEYAKSSTIARLHERLDQMFSLLLTIKEDRS